MLKKNILLWLHRSKRTPRFVRSLFFTHKYLKQSGWLQSWRQHRPVDATGDPIPWFTYPAIAFIEEKLAQRPLKIFEYGSGNSTKWFASRVASIYSVENDSDFYVEMQPQLAPIENVTYELVTLEDGYSRKILDFNNEFDVIIVDGRERVECTKNTLDALAEGGVIIFDNSDRKRYQEAYDFLRENGFKQIDFVGPGPLVYAAWKTSVFYRDNNCFDI